MSEEAWNPNLNQLAVKNKQKNNHDILINFSPSWYLWGPEVKKTESTCNETNQDKTSHTGNTDKLMDLLAHRKLS